MGAEAQREGQEELRHHPLRLRRNEKLTAKKHAASGERPGLVRCLFGVRPVSRPAMNGGRSGRSIGGVLQEGVDGGE